jgi:putative ABC transport system permease protein
MLCKNPGFTAVAILTLALGIGGTTAIFSVIYGVVLSPFPYRDSRRLVVLSSQDVRKGTEPRWADISSSEFLDYQEQNSVFAEMFANGGGRADALVLPGADGPQHLWGARNSGNFFQVLGVPALIGRIFIPEDAKPGAPPVAVLNYHAWQSKFGGDPQIVGRVFVMYGQPTTVIGVMPPRFQWSGKDVWLPVSLSRDGNDSTKSVVLAAHLKPGVSLEQARAEIEVLAGRFSSLYPKDHPRESKFSVEPLDSFTDPHKREFRKTLSVLLGAMAFLLLIACLNVANLLLARAIGREKEIAVRASLGASRARLVRQLLIESLLLALVGAALGCLFAWDLLEALVAIIPAHRLPGESLVRMNGPVLLFSLGVALLSTLLSGLAQALLTARKDLHEPLKASGRGAGESLRHSRLRNLLVVSEVALCLVLLTGAGLLIRSFVALRQVELGYKPDNVLTGLVRLPLERYGTAEQWNQFRVESLRRVRALPGVVSAALGAPGPTYRGFPIDIQIAGEVSAEDEKVQLQEVSDAFFETLGIRTLQGRTISEEDFRQGARVAVVNRAFATKYFRNTNPLGRQIKMKGLVMVRESKQPLSLEVVGVVEDVRKGQDGWAPQPEIYVSCSVRSSPFASFKVRIIADAAHSWAALRRELAAIDKGLAIEQSQYGVPGVTERDILTFNWLIEPRFILGALGGLAALGLTLVSMGVYSILSYAVSRRTQEIGIRMALGAQPANVRWMVMASGLRWLAIGVGIGVPTSVALARILQNRIWGITSADPLTLIAVSLLMTGIGLAACYFPARRATKVDPIVALRYE